MTLPGWWISQGGDYGIWAPFGEFIVRQIGEFRESLSMPLLFFKYLQFKIMDVPKQNTSGCCWCCPVLQLYPALCDPMDCSTPVLPVPHHLLEFTRVHVCCIGDAAQPSHPLTPSSPPVLNLSQQQGPFWWAVCSHQVTRIVKFQLQHQSFQWIFRFGFL